MARERRLAGRTLDRLRLASELIGRSRFSLERSSSAIELRRGASRLLLTGRIILTLFLLPFLLAPTVLLLEPDVPTNLPAVVFLGLWYGALAGFAGIMGAIFSRWRLVRFDGSRGRLELRGGGRFIWLPRKVSVPLDRVRGLRLLLGPETLAPLPFIWEIAYRSRGERTRKAHVTVTVEAIDRREEALDLTFRVAELLGWEAVQLERHDALVVELRLARSGAELDDPRPIPRLETWLGYEADPADDGAPEPGLGPPPE